MRCTELLNVAAVGIMMADRNKALQTIAASDEHTGLLWLFAQEHDQRPCVGCCNSGTARTNIGLTDWTIAAKWPRFAVQAQDTGSVIANALPLRLRGRTIDAMGLFQTDPDPLTASDLTLAQALADIATIATIAILQQRTLAHAELERGQLQYALTSRIVLEQVKGILAERWTTSVGDAFTALRTYARSHGYQLTCPAREIADGTFDTDQIPRATNGERN